MHVKALPDAYRLYVNARRRCLAHLATGCPPLYPDHCNIEYRNIFFHAIYRAKLQNKFSYVSDNFTRHQKMSGFRQNSKNPYTNSYRTIYQFDVLIQVKNTVQSYLNER